MGIGPLLAWNKEDKLKIFKKIYPSVLLTIIMTVITFSFYQSYNLIGMIGIILAFWIISNNIILLIKKNKNYSFGMLVAHLGI